MDDGRIGAVMVSPADTLTALPVPATKSSKVRADISALLRARNTCLVLVTPEELRAERTAVDACSDALFSCFFWDCKTGITRADGKNEAPDARDPLAALAWIEGNATGRACLVVRDLSPFLKDPVVCRTVRSLARGFQGIKDRSKSRSIIMISPSADIPVELAACSTFVEYPIPDRAEMQLILDSVVATTVDGIVLKQTGGTMDPELAATVRATLLTAPDGSNVREAATDAALGLTADAAASCYMRSLVTHKPAWIDPVIVYSEKKRAIAGVPGLSWIEPEARGMSALGGHPELKPWVATRRSGFSAAARAYGLPSPRGMVFVGVSGCGKTHLTRCIGGEWGLPIIKLDLNATANKFVGGSEGNIRRAFKVIEAVSPCIVLVDEIEKSLGASGPQGDGGVSSDRLGSFLSWLQDHSGSVFVIATANDVRGLPPELLRKGRFDEVWYGDLPSADERADVLRAALGQYKRPPMSDADVSAVADACDTFTGSEIAAIVPEAMFAAFADGGRPIVAADLITAARSVVPLARTAEKKITELREWAKGRARSTSPGETRTASTGMDRQIDL